MTKEQIIQIVVISIISIIVIVGAVFLCKTVVKRQNCKKHVSDLEKKFEHLRGILTGTDAQNVRRLETISRSNLLYGEIYDDFQKEFKTILEDYCKPADEAVKKIREVINNNDFNNFKVPYLEAKRIVASFEEKVLTFDKNICEKLQPEENFRNQSLKIKEDYRSAKQKFAINERELALVSDTFEQVFVKIERNFDKFETILECADYDQARELLPKISQVISALNHAISELPSLCSQAEKVIPDKIMNLRTDFIDVEKSGVPLFHLGFKSKNAEWEQKLLELKTDFKKLKLNGSQAKLDTITAEIEDLHKQLEQEIADKNFFETNAKNSYTKAIELENIYLKIVAKLPEINSIYVVNVTQQNNLELLKSNINELGIAKRSLDNYIHSATKQPYSVLRSKLEQLMNDYDIARQGVENFKAYVDSIKSNSEDAYGMVFNYFYRLKKIESVLRDMNMPNVTEKYSEPIEKCYELLNQIDTSVKTKPIDVKYVNERVEELKNIAKNLFDDVEKMFGDMKLAESAIVYNNMDRLHQSEVDNKLGLVEADFYNGNFEKVYVTANEIYQNNHVEDK